MQSRGPPRKRPLQRGDSLSQKFPSQFYFGYLKIFFKPKLNRKRSNDTERHLHKPWETFNSLKWFCPSGVQLLVQHWFLHQSTVAHRASYTKGICLRFWKYPWFFCMREENFENIWIKLSHAKMCFSEGQSCGCIFRKISATSVAPFHLITPRIVTWLGHSVCVYW